MSRLTWFVCAAALLVGRLRLGNAQQPVQPVPQPRAEFTQTDLRVGTGTAASTGRFLTVNYTGWLLRPDEAGSERHSVRFRPVLLHAREPDAVIRGWDLGVVGMRVGGLRRLTIPPELAYGSAGSRAPIPGNASLVFDVELLSVQ